MKVQGSLLTQAGQGGAGQGQGLEKGCGKRRRRDGRHGLVNGVEQSGAWTKDAARPGRAAEHGVGRVCGVVPTEGGSLPPSRHSILQILSLCPLLVFLEA